jgi:hypothetical protein
MFAVMVSDIAIVHGFFVWPKLLAASFLLAALALVIAPEWPRLRRDSRAATLLASLLALSFLAHGSSIFGIVPLVVIALFRGVPRPRWIGVAVLAGFALLVPWFAYQHYADPPGNRLLKWQLGGDTQVDSSGTLETIEDGYSDAGWDGTLENKLDNFGEMAGLTRIITEASSPQRIIAGSSEVRDSIRALEAGEFGNALRGIRGPRFFSLLPFLGVFLVAPFAMFVARDRGRKNEADWRFALLCFGFTGIACLFWGLLLFGTIAARATLHVGSLAVPLLALCACVAGLRATYPRFAAALVAFNAFGVLLIYTPSLTPPPGTSYSVVAGLIAVASVAGFGAILYRAAKTSVST